MSSDFEGKIENAGIEYIEDPPYLRVENTKNLSQQGEYLLNQLFNFIVEIKSYKSIIKQIDKETPGLLYLVCENKENVSNENIENINRGIELFKNTINIRNEIINMYKLQVREYFTKKENYFKKLNEIGEKAFKEKIKDIYDIILMTRDNNDNKEENKMYRSIKEAKHKMEKILNKEINDDIINCNDSIIIEQKEE